ncbi:MAG TPA: HNH endonuclease, partial [Acidimicrobiales bacterium]|nr:HNH endonuclease [Acidimicrobiales bacterium]
HLGPVLPAGLADYLSCDSTVRYLLLRHGQPLAMGRRQRTVTPRVRAVIEHRDGGCRVPGCDQARWLHIHHLVHWTHGGGTDPDNLLALCPAHHRMVHHGLLAIRGHPDGLTFIDHYGRRLEPARPQPPHPDTSSAQAARHQGLSPPQWQHPPGEPLDTRWINWN